MFDDFTINQLNYYNVLPDIPVPISTHEKIILISNIMSNNLCMYIEM